MVYTHAKERERKIEIYINMYTYIKTQKYIINIHLYIYYAYLSIYMERKRESPTHGSENSHCLNNMSIITIPVNVSIGTEEILQVLPGRRTMSQ